MNYKKGFVIPLIIAIVAVLAIGGGLYFYNAKNCTGLDDMARALCEANNRGETLGIDGFRPNSNATSTTTDVTAGWKTYTNTQYGFTLDYPSDWRVDSTSPSNIYLISSTTDKMVKDWPNQPATQRVDLSISISLDSQRPFGTQKNITFNGMNAEQVTQESEAGIFTSMYLDKNGYTYVITPVKKSNIGEQILSTFKFIIPTKTSCTPNWQCGWGACSNGYQGMTAVDQNNCGLSSTGVQIACPALARECEITPIIYCPVDSFFDENCVCRPPSSWKIGSKEKGFNCVGGV